MSVIFTIFNLEEKSTVTSVTDLLLPCYLGQELIPLSFHLETANIMK